MEKNEIYDSSKKHFFLLSLLSLQVYFLANAMLVPLEWVDNQNLFKQAVCDGNLKRVQCLINKVDINHQDAKGHTAVMHALKHNENDEILQLLIQNKANLNLTNYKRMTALHIAVEGSGGNTVDLLLQNGANVNRQNDYGWSPLYLAVERKDVALASLLVRHRADPNLKTNYGNTPLHCAVCNADIDLVNILIKIPNIDLNIQNDHGNTALFDAERCATEEIMRLLIDNGADLNKQNTSQETVLMQAVRRGHRKSVELLIDRGANDSLKDYCGDTALSIAKRFGDMTMLSILAKSDISPVVKIEQEIREHANLSMKNEKKDKGGRIYKKKGYQLDSDIISCLADRKKILVFMGICFLCFIFYVKK